ncbi:MAG: hypothetical protein ACREQ9_26945, partial [Candidatus Binatia bacterium]
MYQSVFHYSMSAHFGFLERRCELVSAVLLSVKWKVRGSSFLGGLVAGGVGDDDDDRLSTFVEIFWTSSNDTMNTRAPRLRKGWS